jgi:FtsP/CotA-like multicopper oxidase with cupredoxin domain
LTIERGEQVRLRLINASAATTFRIGITGHRLRVTHADGQRVSAVDVDTLVIGMAERYDVPVTGIDPAGWLLVAGPVDTSVPGVVAPFLYRGYLPSHAPVFLWPQTLLRGRTLTYDDLQPEGTLPIGRSQPRSLPLLLSGGMGMGRTEAWTINGERYPNASPLRIREGEWIRLEMRNQSMVLHPMHLHGHFFRVAGARGLSGRASRTRCSWTPWAGRMWCSGRTTPDAGCSTATTPITWKRASSGCAPNATTSNRSVAAGPSIVRPLVLERCPRTPVGDTLR